MLDNKLALGKQFGATDTVNAAREDVVERIKELTGGLGVTSPSKRLAWSRRHSCRA